MLSDTKTYRATLRTGGGQWYRPNDPYVFTPVTVVVHDGETQSDALDRAARDAGVNFYLCVEWAEVSA